VDETQAECLDLNEEKQKVMTSFFIKNICN